ncbi:MAG TPA: alpha/beta hydrolase [Micromonosporaceae bacterium]|nr:alpha/beta hydrolase [Micromonosporaceae bacterium]
MKLTVSAVGRTLNAISLLAPGLAGTLTFSLFQRPAARRRVRETERDTHARARVEAVRVAGKRVATYRWGDGARPVLLVHGWQSRASRYFALVNELLARGFSPIGFDAPAHGDSDGTTTTILEFHEVIRQLQERYGRFEAIVAHSFGVPCAFHALRSGIEADSLVAISGVCEFSFLHTEFCRRLGLRNAISNDLRMRVEELLQASGTDIWRKFSASYEPHRLTMPLLVIHDEDDPVVPVTQARLIIEAYPRRSRLVTTAGLGHRPLDDPATVARVADFIESPEPMPATGAEARRAPSAAGVIAETATRLAAEVADGDQVLQ